MPVAVPVSGTIQNIQNQDLSDVTLSILGEKRSFPSDLFSSGVLLTTNSEFIIKATKADYLDAFNFHLKTGLADLQNQHLRTISRAELSDLANKAGVAVDPALGIIIGEVVEGDLVASSGIPAGNDPRAVSAGFFNEDNFVDLAITHSPNQVSILLGQGNGAFNITTESPIPVGNDPQSIAVSDFDQDGRLDLAITNRGDNNVSILFGRPEGKFLSRPEPKRMDTL